MDLEIQKGMYGLKEAAILAYEQLCKHLALYSYSYMCLSNIHLACGTTPPTQNYIHFGSGQFWHQIYFNKDEANHLFSALQDKYSITIDWSGAFTLV